jgi:glycosyltransferase involved in cell wall biosynthesis
VSDLRVLMITQKVDLDDDVLGFTHAWVNKLAERVAQLHVLALSVGRHELHDNVTLYSMGKGQGAGRLRRFVNFNRVVAPLVLRCQVDVVFVHMAPLYAILAAPWAKLVRVPMVLWFTHKSVNWKVKLAHWLVDRVVTASAESFRVSSDKVVVTGHGIDTKVFKPAEGLRAERPFTVLSVGRISPIKDYETLVGAADILVNREEHRDFRFVVVGGAGTAEQEEYVHHLRELVKASCLEAHVEFVGSVPHGRVADYYRQASAFVGTSRTGSLDKAGLEAMACGLPLLTCNEAFTHVLGDFSDMLMFDKGNADDLAEKILDVVEIKTESRLVLERVLRDIVVQEHDIERLINRITRVFKELVKIT